MSRISKAYPGHNTAWDTCVSALEPGGLGVRTLAEAEGEASVYLPQRESARSGSVPFLPRRGFPLDVKSRIFLQSLKEVPPCRKSKRP